ncbi:MAG: HD-GYP domain-containing protein [Phycisphaeraceae bacterium]|nr:HD-GYP domain-containing protein [Phycisphaeraceae bacterium]
MQGSLHKPLIDQATQTFVNRCAELVLAVWSYDGRSLLLQETDDTQTREHLAPHADQLAQAIRIKIDELVKAGRPIELAPGQPAAWVADEQGPTLGFIMTPVPNERGAPQTAEQLAPVIKALAWNLNDLRKSDNSLFAVEDLAEQLGKSYENITLLYSIGRSMRSIAEPVRLAQDICEQIRLTQGFGWSAVRFIANDMDASGLSDTCVTSGEMPCDDVLFNKATHQLITEQHDKHWRKLLQVGQDELADLMRCEVIVEPILHDEHVIGAVIAGGKTGPDSEATSGDTQLLDAIAGFLGALHENAARFTEQKNMFIGSLEAVSTALDAKDRYTHGHSERVAWLGTQLAEAVGLDAEEVERIRISGLVHDVGKIGVPEAVLCKAGRLTDDEFDQIKKHPRIGYNILKGIPNIDDVLDGVLYHHERWDGRGYPTRLAGEAIPLYGRILAVADTFDAMSSTRSYRQAMPREKVLKEIANCAGSQFDPSLTDPFINLDFSAYDAMVARHQGDSEQPAKDLAA